MRQIVLTPDGALIRESVQYRDIGQGFYAVPHVSGDQVSVEIALQADQLGFAGRQDVRTERLSTTLAGRLGEWLLLGGGQTERGGRSDNEGVASTREVRGQGSLWLKVEAAD